MITKNDAATPSQSVPVEHHDLQLIRLAALTVLLLLAPFAAQDALAFSACPAPSVAQGSQCVLRTDASLSDTMWLPSGTHLDCQGHRLTPMTTGTLDNPRTMVNEFQPSKPELALFVHSAYDVTIQNCVISGFDFGIIVAQSKAVNAPNNNTMNTILGNTIDVRTNPIDVINSDGVLITGNSLTYASERGRGIVIDFDSDNNQIVRNTVTSTDAASTGQVHQLPGGPFVTGSAIMDNKIHILQGDKELQNFVVSGVLIQVPAGVRNTDLEDTSRSSNNLVQSNNIVDLGEGPSCTLDPSTSCQADTDCSPVNLKGACLLKQDSGVGFNIRASDNTVVGNVFSGHMVRGISFGGVNAVMTFANWYPGTCTLQPNQLCSMDSDCNIPGYNIMSGGTCTGVGPVTFNGNTLRLTAEANVLFGVYDNAALFANMTDTFVYSGNTVSGGASGIRINADAINGTVERNVVSGAGNALYLSQPSFTAAIRLNDFTNYSAAIRTSDAFTVHTDISADKGNYWGLPCPGFDPARVFFDNGSVNPFLFDGKPYGQPVARTPDGVLPMPCSSTVAGSAPASGTACNGTYNGTFVGNLTVSAGQTCAFVAGGVTGNITQTGGNLVLSGATVGGNVQVQSGGTFSLNSSTSIHGDLQIQNLPASAAQNQICSVNVGGNLQYQNSASPVEIGAATVCPGNTVGGDLQVHNNTAAASIFNNTVIGNLQVQSNTASVMVSSNTVTKNLQCDGNTTITGNGNVAQQKQGQCATF